MKQNYTFKIFPKIIFHLVFNKILGQIFYLTLEVKGEKMDRSYTRNSFKFLF